MVNFAVITKILIVDSNDSRLDSVTGSAAKAISDYLETVDNTKVIRAIEVSQISNTQAQIVIIHDS